MELWKWYSHSWYPPGYEINYDLRRWAIGFSFSWGWCVYLGPLTIVKEQDGVPF